MSYDYVNYRRRQYDLPQPAQPFHPYQPVQPRLATCWNPPGSHDPPGIPPYDQPPPRYRSEPYGPPQPHRMGSVQTRRPSCWEPPPCRASRGYSDYDQPVQQIDRCRPPPYNGPYMEPDSDLQPRQSYARYRSWQPQYQPRSATKAEDPINAKLDRLLEACDKIETWFDATNRRFSKFRSSPQPEPDLDQPNVSAPLRKMAYPPSRNNEASFGPSRLVPNESTAPPRHRTKSDQTPARQPSCWEPPLMATPAVDQIHQPYQPPLPLPRSNHPPQPSPAQPLELPPYSTPGPFQPLQPLPETAPLLASNRLPQAAVPSSRPKEWQMNMQKADEYGLINKVVPCSHDVVGEKNIVEDKWKENGMGPKGLVESKDDEDSDILKMIEMITVRAFDPGICVSFSNQKGEFLALQIAKPDLRDSKKELPHEEVIKCLFATGTFRIELPMPATHVVFNTAPEFNGDLNVTDITSMNPRLPSLDADARLIPPRNNKPCLIIQGRVAELSILALNLDDHISLPSLIFYGGDEGTRSAARCVFDPGGDASPRLLLSTLVVASWFPP